MSASRLIDEKFKIPLKEIERATNEFNDENYIGEGGFGLVYRGKLSGSWQNRIAAIKRNHKNGKQGTNEFLAELKLISLFHHQNIIPFIGYCEEGGEKIIVYEYAVNGSLYDHIRIRKKKCCLTWVQRLKICLGAAKGIMYLHSGLGEHTQVIHRDVKSANILLDDDFEAKVCDFGLSRLRSNHESQVYTVAAGTSFYMDPVYQESSKLQKESDIYSFGVVLFEMLTGNWAHKWVKFDDGKDHRLINLVKHCYERGVLEKLIDPDIKQQIDIKSFDLIGISSFHTIQEIAYKCISMDVNKRPTIDRLIKEIEEALDIQEKNPALIECFRKEVRFSQGKPVAAFAIYKCFLEWKSFESETTGVFGRLIHMIGSAIKKEGSIDYTAYWSSTALALLLLIQGSLKLEDPSSVQAAAADALDEPILAQYQVLFFKQELTSYVEELYAIMCDNLKKELESLLNLKNLAPQASRGALKSEFSDDKDSQSNFSQRIVDRLDTLLNTLKENFVPPVIVRLILSQLFSYINVKLFNSIFSDPEGCTFANAKYLKAGLYKLDQWRLKYVGSISDELKHLRQAVDFLVYIKNYSPGNVVEIEHFGRSLNFNQLIEMCNRYREEDGRRGKAIHVNSWLKKLKRKHTNNEEDESPIEMEDSYSEYFSVRDLLTSHKVTRFASGKPNVLLAKYPDFDTFYR